MYIFLFGDRDLIEKKNNADEKFRNKMYAEAVRLYGDALKGDSEAHRWNAILYSNRAAAYMTMGRYQEAVADCHQSIARDSDYIRAYLRRARAHLQLGNFSASIQDYRKYLSTEPRPTDVRQVMSELDDVIDKQHRQQAAQKAAQSKARQDKSYAQYTERNFGKGAAGEGKGTNSRTGGHSAHTRSWQDDQDDDSDDDYDDAGSYSEHFKSHFPGHGHKMPEPKFRWGAKSGGGGDASSSNSSKSSNSGSNNSGSNSAGSKKSNGEQDYYNILEVNSKATEREIKTSYRKLALKFHPDKNKDEGAEDIFKSITAAYSVLSDTVSRQKYDLSRPLTSSWRTR